MPERSKINLGIDTSTHAGKLVYSIVAAVTEMERYLLIERTNSGLAASRAPGRKGGSKREFSPAAVRKAQEQYDKGELSVSEKLDWLVSVDRRFTGIFKSPENRQSELATSPPFYSISAAR